MLAVCTCTAPPTLTATEPPPPLTPIVARRSRFVAVTARPRNGVVAAVIVVSPSRSDAFGWGTPPSSTMLWSSPVARLLSSAMAVLASALSFVVARQMPGEHEPPTIA